jgi:membrane-bound lytic murein transglycosylase B
MRFISSVSFSLAALALSATAALAAPCGGNFSNFVKDLRAEATAKGHDAQTAKRFFANVRQDPKVLKADRAQGVFQLDFTTFARRLISADRMKRGQSNARKYDAVFNRVERDFGVSRGVLLAFWAFETDYGAFQGDFNTLNALVTLAHDCRRPELIRPQVFAAMKL